MGTSASSYDEHEVNSDNDVQVPDTVEAALREADVLDQDGNISLEEFERLIHSSDSDILDLFDTRHHQ